METPNPNRLPEINMDIASLYREEVFTDRKVGMLRVLHPVKADGSDDGSRETIYSGEAQLMSTIGALPVAFDIPAKNLEEALAGYKEAARQAVEQTVEELQELRRQAASSLVIPQTGGGLGGTPGMGGLGGGGKIQMP
jgi:hypothetical protein